MIKMEISEQVNENKFDIEALGRFIAQVSVTVQKTSKDLRESELRLEKSQRESELRLEKSLKDSKNYLNKEMGRLSRRLGDIVEDLVLPNVDSAINDAFGDKINDLQANRLKREGKDEMEIDVIAISGRKLYLIETKSTLRWEYIKKFEKIISSGKFFRFFPEYKDYEIIQIMASLKINHDMLKYLLNMGIYPMITVGGFMKIIKEVSEIELP